jgi:hypothetical protein
MQKGAASSRTRIELGSSFGQTPPSSSFQLPASGFLDRPASTTIAYVGHSLRPDFLVTFGCESSG